MSNSNINLQTQSSNALHNAIMEAGSKYRPPMLAPVPVAEGSSKKTTERYMENYKNVSQDIRDQLNAEAEAVQIILTGIDNDIHSTVDACPNACEMWKAIKSLKQGESINVQDLETNLYWEFGKFTSRDVLTSTTTRMAKNEVNEIRAERLARTVNPLALVAQQQPVYHHQNHPTQNTQYSSTKSQQSTRNRGKAIFTSSAPTYDPEPDKVTEDEEMSKDKEIDKLMALISLSFKKIYKPTNNNLRTSSNTSRANQDNSLRINRGTGYDNQRAVLNAEQADWKDDTDDESDNQELEAHYMYMAQIHEVTPDPVDNSGPIFDDEPMHKNTNVIAPGMYKVHTKPNQTRTQRLPQDIRKTNKRVSFSTGVIPTTSVSRPQLKSNQLEDRVMSNNSQGKKQEVEDHRRNFKFSNNKTSVTACNDSLNAKTSNVNFVCVTCGKCVLNDNHDLCVLHYINGVNSRTRQPMAVPISTREPKHNVNQSVATSSKKTVATDSTVKKSRNITRKLYEQVSKTCSWWYPKYTPPGYNWKPKSQIGNVNPNLVEIILFIVDSGCSKYMTGNLKLLTNFVEKFLGTVKFGNDQIAPILGYGDLVQGTITIKRVYYVEGLNHNLFSVGQFCDADLEVAFRKSTCYIRDLKGNDLLTGSRGTDLYSITLQDSTTPNPICLMAKATSSQAWLWHRRLSHLNFDTINLLSKNNIVNGLPKLKFVKDHLCSSCELGKAKRKSFHTKTTPSSKRRLQLLHMDLCGPMRVESINGKK
ncbi:retrovirus-related pol polyprotein from transposon TNT 1-94 [Tanacetum coccineum]